MKNKNKLIIIFLLLFTISILYRIQYIYPHHPDHFTWGSFTNAMITNGYAPWVLHPTSLFGYYPLSVPSGFEFFFANVSILTGINLSDLFFIFSIFFGIFGAINVYILMRRWTSFLTSFLTSFVLLTMAFYAKVTSNTGSNRIMNLVFYPIFIVLLFNIIENWKTNKLRSIKYAITSILLFIMMALIHRLTQLSIIFVVSVILAIILSNWEKLLEKFISSQFYKKRKSIYDLTRLHIVSDIMFLFILLIGYGIVKSKLVFLALFFVTVIHFWLTGYRKHKGLHFAFIDFALYISLVIIAKAGDLYIRGRLNHHINNFLMTGPIMQTIIISIVVIIALIFVVKYKKVTFKFLEKIVDKIFIYVEKKPERGVSIGLFLVLIFFMITTFTEGGFLELDRSYYEESFILKGTSNFVILINFLFNLNNNLTILIWFCIAGLGYLFFTKNKTTYHYFFIFTAIFFSQLVFDWEYVRLYMNPLYAIFIGIGLSFVLRKILTLGPKLKIASISLLIIIFCSHFALSQVFMHRDKVFDELNIKEDRDKLHEEYYISAGNYLSNFDGVSIMPSKQEVRVQRIAFYGQISEAVIAQSIYTNTSKYDISSISYDEIEDKLLSGRKVTNIFDMRDWIFGGGYYHGKHIYRLTNQRLFDRYSNEVINEYHIRFIADSNIAKTKFKFFDSIEPLKNKIFTTPQLSIYDLQRGRV